MGGGAERDILADLSKRYEAERYAIAPASPIAAVEFMSPPEGCFAYMEASISAPTLTLLPYSSTGIVMSVPSVATVIFPS